MVLKTRIVLASKSPRREALLRGLELPCELEVVPADIDESCYQMSVPRAQAAVLSVVKSSDTKWTGSEPNSSRSAR